jgi:hypothetical protein
MAGNCSVARAMGRLSLARERVDSETPLIVPTPRIHPLPLSQGERMKSARAPTSEKRYAAESSRLTTPNMLWSGSAKNPPNCVFFACHPQMPAVLTS